MKNTRRLHILNDDDIQSLYQRPEFTDTERRHFFSLPKDVLTTLNIRQQNSRRVAGLVYFILQYGYFKAKHQFFMVNFAEVSADVQFIMETFLPNDPTPNTLPSRDRQRGSKIEILKAMDYTADGKAIRDKLSIKLADCMRRITDPVEIFDEAIKYLTDEHCMVLGYKVMQDLIGAAFKAEEQRLSQRLQQHISPNVIASLEKLLTKDPEQYLVTTLQADAQSFQLEQMRKEREKLALCHDIYQFSRRFLAKMDLSQAMITHYAELTRLYKGDRLSRRERSLAYVYLICYVRQRYERIMNNCVQGFLHHTDKQHDLGKRYMKEHLPKDPGPIEQHKKSLGKLISLFTQEKIMQGDGSSIRQHAFNIMPKDEIVTISNKLLDKNRSQFKKQQALIWQYHKERSQRVVLNLRPLFLASIDASLFCRHLIR